MPRKIMAAHRFVQCKVAPCETGEVAVQESRWGSGNITTQQTHDGCSETSSMQGGTLWDRGGCWSGMEVL